MSVFLPLVAGSLTYGAGRDPYINNVSLLLHAEGSNGSTTITDSSKTPKTVTATSTCAISTALFKFGSSSILGGASGYFTATLGTAGNMTADFTWESWVYGGLNRVVFYNGGDATTGIYCYNGQLRRIAAGVETNIVAITTNVSAAWHHLAISRTGSTIKGYADGVQIGSATDSSTIDLQTLKCGLYVPNGNLFWTTNYDEMRVTKGVGRYPSAFTPPTRKFPDN